MTLKARIKWDGLASPVRYGEIDIPSRFELIASPTDDDSQPGFVIEIEAIENKLRVTEVRVTASSHGRGVLRSDLVMPLEDHLEFAAQWVAALHDPNLRERAEIDLTDLGPSFMQDLRRARRTDLRRGPSDDDLRTAADIYRSAERAPVKAVRQHFDLAERTAYLWVSRAREKGYLS